MKKIMFDDRYSLTKAVSDGMKTNTRRDELSDSEQSLLCEESVRSVLIENGFIRAYNSVGFFFSKPTRYRLGEVVAVAQSYKDLGYKIYDCGHKWAKIYKDDTDGMKLVSDKGFRNKMYVDPSLMPLRIRITGIRIERLQDISDEDCLKEGIFEDAYDNDGVPRYFYDYYNNEGDGFSTPREAFASLINRVSGKKTWERNPYVVAYTFRLEDGKERLPW